MIFYRFIIQTHIYCTYKINVILTFLPSKEYIVLTPLGNVTLSTKTLVKSAVKLSNDLKTNISIIQYIGYYFIDGTM